MNEKLEEMNNRETLIVLKWQFGIPDYKVRHDVLDEKVIKEVNEVFENSDWQDDDDELIEKIDEETSKFNWDWQENDERSRPLPHFQIGNYEVWVIDQFVHAINLKKDRYAKLTKDDSEFILTFLIDIGVAH